MVLVEESVFFHILGLRCFVGVQKLVGNNGIVDEALLYSGKM